MCYVELRKLIKDMARNSRIFEREPAPNMKYNIRF